jgi:hypothetical protein
MQCSHKGKFIETVRRSSVPEVGMRKCECVGGDYTAMCLSCGVLTTVYVSSNSQTWIVKRIYLFVGKSKANENNNNKTK